MKRILLFATAAITLAACGSFTQRGVAEAPAPGDEAARKYFIVQNVATERTRVYEKCQEDAKTKSCVPGSKNRLVFESEMVVGGDDLRSDVGVQNIGKWVKFYEDGGQKYPSWYDPNYPATPTGGFKKWFKSEAMPNKSGEMRGAFGWYTALMEPSKTGQWMHGTIGWGKEGDHYIKLAHGAGITGFLGKLFTDMRSHGCTRHENQGIAYLQSLVPPGTALIKIYAKEGLADASLSRYEGQKTQGQWDWILTKEDVRSNKPQTSTASEVQARLDSGKISQSDVIEKGTYKYNQYPVAVEIRKGKSGESGKSGDSYKLFKKEEPRGLFLVDEGVITSDYQHPTEIEKDGIKSFNPTKPEFAGKVAPNYAIQVISTVQN